MTMNNLTLLKATLSRIAQLQQQSVDRLAIEDAVCQVETIKEPKKQLKQVSQALSLKSAKWINAPDPGQMPLIYFQKGEWGIIRGKNAQDHWILEKWDSDSASWSETNNPSLDDYQVADLHMAKRFMLSQSHFFQVVKEHILQQKKLLTDVIVASVVINTVALAASFYTLQVYDRVVPTGSSQTLLALTLGVFFAIFYELITKKIRGSLSLKLTEKVDAQLARLIYQRFLSIRLDQMPKHVGSLASQIRGYETVRQFLSTITTYMLVDLPFALIFVVVIYSIAGVLAVIPFIFMLLGIGIGLLSRKKVIQLSNSNRIAQNQSTGMLVESVTGAETIKSGQAGWRMLSTWQAITQQSRQSDIQLKRITETGQYFIQACQQFSYVSLIASGALIISQGELTTGGLIACSILSSRILAPTAMIPNHIMQWGQFKSALMGLDHFWQLKNDHHDIEHPLVPELIYGDFLLENIVAQYDQEPAFCVEKLAIKRGEKIGILGPVGAGKTTLLRLLSGMYKPQEGRILLDGMDIAHIAKPLLANHTAFVQQEAILFAGTLRDNLILGLIDPGDEAIIHAANQTGLLESVIQRHPKGLSQPIYEGGSGLSGGQKQLVNLTRSLMRKPSIWLMDEPTSSMDRMLEQRIRKVVFSTIKSTDTVFLVTHKMEMLAEVDRLIFLAQGKVVLDGPKDEVLKQLNQFNS